MENSNYILGYDNGVKHCDELDKKILELKKESYNYNNMNNFKFDKELTVTITLNEYRELIKKTSISDYEMNKLKTDNYAKTSEIDKLKTKKDELDSILYKYMTKYGTICEQEDIENE